MEDCSLEDCYKHSRVRFYTGAVRFLKPQQVLPQNYSLCLVSNCSLSAQLAASHHRHPPAIDKGPLRSSSRSRTKCAECEPGAHKRKKSYVAESDTPHGCAPLGFGNADGGIVLVSSKSRPRQNGVCKRNGDEGGGMLISSFCDIDIV